MNTRLFQKDFITTPDWTVEDLNTMLDLAFRLKGDCATGVLHDQILRAKTLYMLFFEESTRTRNSSNWPPHASKRSMRSTARPATPAAPPPSTCSTVHGAGTRANACGWGTSASAASWPT